MIIPHMKTRMDGYTRPYACLFPVYLSSRHNYTQTLQHFSTQELCALAQACKINYCVPFFSLEKVDGEEMMLSTKEEFMSRLKTSTGEWDIYQYWIFISVTCCTAFCCNCDCAIACAPVSRRRARCQSRESVESPTTVPFLLQICNQAC